MMTTVGKRLKEFREFKQLKQNAFSEATGIRQQTLSTLEADGSVPSYPIIEKIMTAFPDLSGDWFLMGRGTMLVDGRNLLPISIAPTTVSSASPEVAIATQPAVATLTRQLAEAHEEIKQLHSELRQTRKEAREDLIAQARTYNSVKQGGAELIANLYAFINRQNVKIDEYELRLGYRQPTPEEAERFKQAEAERKPISGFMGQRYSELLEAVEAEATTGGKQIFLKLAA